MPEFFTDKPTGAFRLEPTPRWIRGRRGSTLVVDSRSAYLVWDGTRPVPRYFVPKDDVRADEWIPGSKKLDHPTLGPARFWTLRVGDAMLENAAWQFPDAPEAAMRDLVALKWSSMDSWFEEEEEVRVHPRDPYKRVDALATSRHIVVQVDGHVLADTTRAQVLYETSLPPRYYIPKSDVQMGLLHESQTVTECPYKGVTKHYSARVDGATHEDVAWTYPFPLSTVGAIRDYVCFYNERADLTVDGIAQERPKTPWS